MDLRQQPSQSLFRWALVLTCLLGLASGTIDLALPSLVPEHLRKPSDPIGDMRNLYFTAAVGIAFLIGLTVSVAGLFLFKPWALLWALVITVTGLALYPFMGISVTSSWSSMLQEAANVLWGLVLALAFFSPLREKFRSNAATGTADETSGQAPRVTGFGRMLPDLVCNLAAGTRLAVFLRVQSKEFSVSAGQLVLLVVCELAVNFVASFAANGRAGYFNVWALPYLFFHLPFLLLAGYWVCRRETANSSALKIPVAILSAAVPMQIFVRLAYWGLGAWKPGAWQWWWNSYYAFVAWWILIVAVAVYRAGAAPPSRRLATVALAVVLIVGPVLLFPGGPHSELWAQSYNEEDRPSRARGAVASERAIYAHAEVLERSLAKLEKQRKGVVDLYFAAFAGDSSQDVFMRETGSFAKLFRQRFDAEGRTIELINNSRTFSDFPLASHTSLVKTLSHIGKTINREEDIVFLYMTSHGSKTHRFSVNFRPLDLDDISPQMLKTAFDEAGIKWRVIVVSACYAGGFIEPLKDEYTLVITAADATHMSFGCSNEADFTYFGQAYFNALEHNYSFIDAFAAARSSIEQREKSEDKEASNPQMYEGARIRRKLEQLETRLKAAGRKGQSRLLQGAG